MPRDEGEEERGRDIGQAAFGTVQARFTNLVITQNAMEPAGNREASVLLQSAK